MEYDPPANNRIAGNFDIPVHIKKIVITSSGTWTNVDINFIRPPPNENILITRNKTETFEIQVDIDNVRSVQFAFSTGYQLSGGEVSKIDFYGYR